MPGHRRGVEDISLAGHEFADVFKFRVDLTHLNDPPLSRTGVHMPERRVRIKWGGIGGGGPTAVRVWTGAIRIQGIVRIGETIKRIGEQMVLENANACGRTGFGGFKQVPVRHIGFSVGGRPVGERDPDNLTTRHRRQRFRIGGGIQRFEVEGIHVHPERGLIAGDFIRKRSRLHDVHDRPAHGDDGFLALDIEMHFARDDHHEIARVGVQAPPEFRARRCRVVFGLNFEVFHDQLCPIGLARMFGFQIRKPGERFVGRNVNAPFGLFDPVGLGRSGAALRRQE